MAAPPRTAAELRPKLAAFGLSLAWGWYSETVLDAPDGLAAEKQRVGRQLELFRAVGAACIVYGETAGTIQNMRAAPLSSRRRLSEDQIRVYGHRLTARRLNRRKTRNFEILKFLANFHQNCQFQRMLKTFESVKELEAS